ncbi:MAG: hypothetical protein ACI808_000616 [Paraglaciecola sp.]
MINLALAKLKIQDMDVVQQKLKNLLEQTDIAFDECKNHPNSEDYAVAYENAKDELQQFISNMHKGLENRYK